MITKMITKKIKENLKFEQISNVTAAAVMQLSRDFVEVSSFRSNKKAAMLSFHLFIYTFISHLNIMLKCWNE